MAELFHFGYTLETSEILELPGRHLQIPGPSWASLQTSDRDPGFRLSPASDWLPQTQPPRLTPRPHVTGSSQCQASLRTCQTRLLTCRNTRLAPWTQMSPAPRWSLWIEGPGQHMETQSLRQAYPGEPRLQAHPSTCKIPSLSLLKCLIA